MELKEYRRRDAIDRLEKVTNLMRRNMCCCHEIPQLNDFLVTRLVLQLRK